MVAHIGRSIRLSIHTLHRLVVALIDITKEAFEEGSNKLGSALQAYIADVSDKEQCRETVDQIALDLGKIDILVNSAGVVYRTLVLDIGQEEYDQILNANLNAGNK